MTAKRIFRLSNPFMKRENILLTVTLVQNWCVQCKLLSLFVFVVWSDWSLHDASFRFRSHDGQTERFIFIQPAKMKTSFLFLVPFTCFKEVMPVNGRRASKKNNSLVQKKHHESAVFS